MNKIILSSPKITLKKSVFRPQAYSQSAQMGPSMLPIQNLVDQPNGAQTPSCSLPMACGQWFWCFWLIFVINLLCWSLSLWYSKIIDIFEFSLLLFKSVCTPKFWLQKSAPVFIGLTPNPTFWSGLNNTDKTFVRIRGTVPWGVYTLACVHTYWNLPQQMRIHPILLRWSSSLYVDYRHFFL